MKPVSEKHIILRDQEPSSIPPEVVQKVESILKDENLGDQEKWTIYRYLINRFGMQEASKEPRNLDKLNDLSGNQFLYFEFADKST